MSDPIRRLEHDHVPLRQLTDELRARLDEALAAPVPAALQRPFADVLGELREELLTHFANEEEGLFPVLLGALPTLAPRVDELQRSHDSLCGLAARLTHLAQPGAHAFAEHLSQVEALVHRLESEYERHSDAERAVLREADRALSPTQKEDLARALEGL